MNKRLQILSVLGLLAFATTMNAPPPGPGAGGAGGAGSAGGVAPPRYTPTPGGGADEVEEDRAGLPSLVELRSMAARIKTSRGAWNLKWSTEVKQAVVTMYLALYGQKLLGPFHDTLTIGNLLDAGGLNTPRVVRSPGHAGSQEMLRIIDARSYATETDRHIWDEFAYDTYELKILRRSLTSLQGLARIEGLERVTDLDLSDNKLQKLPSGLHRDLPHLARMNVAGNELSSLPLDLGGLSELIRLDMSNNSFRNFPSVILQLVFLRSLFAHDNQIETLPETGWSHPHLRDLQLSRNRLGSFPDGLLRGCPHINFLEIDRNPRLTELPESFFLTWPRNPTSPRYSFCRLFLAGTSLPPETIKRLRKLHNRLHCCESDVWDKDARCSVM